MSMPKTPAYGSLEELLFNFWPLFPAGLKGSLEHDILFLFCYLDVATELFLSCSLKGNRSSSVNLTLLNLPSDAIFPDPFEG